MCPSMSYMSCLELVALLVQASCAANVVHFDSIIGDQPYPLWPGQVEPFDHSYTEYHSRAYMKYATGNVVAYPHYVLTFA